jgi:hypothetical protein
VFLEAGFCVANCLLTNEEDAETYVSSLPFVQRRQIFDVEQRLELLRQEIEQARQSDD